MKKANCKINYEFNCFDCIDFEKCLISNDLSITEKFHESNMIELFRFQKKSLELNSNI